MFYSEVKKICHAISVTIVVTLHCSMHGCAVIAPLLNVEPNKLAKCMLYMVGKNCDRLIWRASASAPLDLL